MARRHLHAKSRLPPPRQRSRKGEQHSFEGALGGGFGGGGGGGASEGGPAHGVRLGFRGPRRELQRAGGLFWLSFLLGQESGFKESLRSPRRRPPRLGSSRACHSLNISRRAQNAHSYAGRGFLWLASVLLHTALHLEARVSLPVHSETATDHFGSTQGRS